MELRDIQVTKRHDGFSSVFFRGQGGESIEVCLAEADGDPVDRARAVMTQVAAFGVDEDTRDEREGDSTPDAPDAGFGQLSLSDRDD